MKNDRFASLFLFLFVLAAYYFTSAYNNAAQQVFINQLLLLECKEFAFKTSPVLHCCPENCVYKNN